MWKRGSIISILILGILLPIYNAHAGTISSAHRYAWSNNVGYINFENVIVSDSSLSGYAWSTNSGWIKFNPARGGVSNDGSGKLSGFAWGEGLGWIDFSLVTVSSTTGRFSGRATGEVVGIINFDCPNYCDVVTDWRGVPVTPPVTPPVPPITPPVTPPTPPPVTTGSTGGTSSSGSRMNLALLNQVTGSHESSDGEASVSLQDQSGNLEKVVKGGTVTVDIPANNVERNEPHNAGVVGSSSAEALDERGSPSTMILWICFVALIMVSVFYMMVSKKI